MIKSLPHHHRKPIDEQALSSEAYCSTGVPPHLTADQLQHLIEVQAAVEWFANIDNRAHAASIRPTSKTFCDLMGLNVANRFRAITRPHVLTWRAKLKQRGLAQTDTAVQPARSPTGEQRSRQQRFRARRKAAWIESDYGKTSAHCDHQAKGLLDALKR